MKYDLKQPCKNCPFGRSEHRIRFRGRERAEEIEEQAYRRGFPCHKSAVLLEEDEDPRGQGGFVPGPGTQHCAGAAGMFINEGSIPWPGIDNDEELAEKIAARMGREGLKMCFDSSEDFFQANEEEESCPSPK